MGVADKGGIYPAPTLNWRLREPGRGGIHAALSQSPLRHYSVISIDKTLVDEVLEVFSVIVNSNS